MGFNSGFKGLSYQQSKENRPFMQSLVSNC